MKVPTDIVLTHAAPGEWAELQCYGALQPERGTFAGRAVMNKVLGKGKARRCVERGDVEELPDGRWRIVDWDFQEGDHTVNERMKKWRAQRGSRHINMQLFPLVDVSRPNGNGAIANRSDQSGYGGTVTRVTAGARRGA